MESETPKLFCPHCGAPLTAPIDSPLVVCGHCGTEFNVRPGVSGPTLVQSAGAAAQDVMKKMTAELALNRLQGELNTLNQTYDHARAQFNTAQNFLTRAYEDLKISLQRENLHKAGYATLALAVILILVGTLLLSTSNGIIALANNTTTWLILICITILISGAAFFMIRAGADSPRQVQKPEALRQQIAAAERDIQLAHLTMSQVQPAIQAKINEINSLR